MASTVLLSGLPGAGINRLLNGFGSQSTIEFEKFAFRQLLQTSPAGQSFIWVLDLRQDLTQLQSQAWLFAGLEYGLSKSDAVILNFVEAADLAQQTQWQAFLRENFSDLTVFRSFHHALPAGLVEFAQNPLVTVRLDRSIPAALQSWQVFEFELQRVSLEALMMSLANSQQSLQMKIARIQANLLTLEYENRVALEVSGFLWKTFAADPDDKRMDAKNTLRIEGVNLEAKWLESLVSASEL